MPFEGVGVGQEFEAKVGLPSPIDSSRFMSEVTLVACSPPYWLCIQEVPLAACNPSQCR
jgi:hypothetical protein